MPPQSLKTVGGALRHRWLVVVAMALVGLGAGWAGTVVRHKTYAATATLLLDERAVANAGADVALAASDVMSQQDIDMITSTPFLAEVCGGKVLEGSCSPADLAKQVSVTLAKGTYLIQVTVSDRDPARAATIADVIVRQAVVDNAARAAALVAPTKALLTGQMSSLNGQVLAAQASLQALGGGQNANDANVAARIDALNAELNRLDTQYSNAYQQLQTVQVQEQNLSHDLSVVQTATVPTRPVDPDPLRYLGVGGAAGLLLGLLLALLVELVDPRLSNGHALAGAAGLPTVIEDDRRSRRGAWGLGRASLLSRHPDARTILLVPASRRDDARATAARLAAAAAEAGQRVLLVEQLSGRNGAQAVTPVENENGVTVYTPNGRELASVLHQNAAYDLTVIAAQPLEESPTGVLLAPRLDLVAIVASRWRTWASQARRTAELLRSTGAEPATGILVANEPRRKAPAEARAVEKSTAADQAGPAPPSERRGRLRRAAARLGQRRRVPRAGPSRP